MPHTPDTLTMRMFVKKTLDRLILSRSLRQCIVVITDQTLCSVTTFLTSALVARACTQSEYGAFVLGLTILLFVTGIQNSLISTPYTITYPKCDPSQRPYYLGSALIHQVAMCIVAAVGFYIASFVCSQANAAPATTSTMFMLAIAATAFMMREFIRLITLAELRVWRNLAMSLVANLATIAAVSISFHSHTLTVSTAYLLITLCSGLPALCFASRYWATMRVSWSRVQQDYKANWTMGKWLVARTFAYSGAISIYPVALACFHGTAATGKYGACSQIASLLNPLVVALNSFLLPSFSRIVASTRDNVSTVAIRIAIALCALLCIVLVVMTVCGEYIMTHVYGATYQDTRGLLLLCVVAFSASVVGSPLSTSLDARGRTYTTYKGRVIGLVASLTVGVPLACYCGPVGAACGLAVSQIASTVYYGAHAVLSRNSC